MGRTRYARFHGANVVQDFGEAPSQLLENWCWTNSTLRALSQHYSTLSPEYCAAWKQEHGLEGRENSDKHPPEKIPNELIDRLLEAKKCNKALFYLGQLHVATFDMMVHGVSSHRAVQDLHPSALWNKLKKEMIGFDGPEVQGQGYEWGHPEVTFGHFMDEYDAGYYAYLR